MHETQELDERTILHPFGLVPNNRGGGAVFHSELIEAARKIREQYPISSYDHRPLVPPYDRQFDFIKTESFRIGYAAFKHTVAAVLQPRSITEIGIGSGVAALAFLQACPATRYHGIDDGSKNLEQDCHVTDYAIQKMRDLELTFEIQIEDSMRVHSAPRADLFHVDGAHDFAHAVNDTRLAFESGSPWILVDDSRDPTVCAGAMMAAFQAQKMFHWAYFEDTWTGSILFHVAGV